MRMELADAHGAQAALASTGGSLTGIRPPAGGAAPSTTPPASQPQQVGPTTTSPLTAPKALDENVPLVAELRLQLGEAQKELAAWQTVPQALPIEARVSKPAEVAATIASAFTELAEAKAALVGRDEELMAMRASAEDALAQATAASAASSTAHKALTEALAEKAIMERKMGVLTQVRLLV